MGGQSETERKRRTPGDAPYRDGSVAIAATEIGSGYLNSLSIAQRRTNGLVFTPPHVVDFVLTQAGFVESGDVENSMFLDPACGAGAFLVGAVRRIAGHLRARAVDVRSSKGRGCLMDILERVLFGVDLDEAACALAVTSVQTAVASLTGAKVAASFFRRNIIQRDYLLGLSASDLKKSGQVFDFVVGNPPYVSTTRLSNEYKKQLRSKFMTPQGRIDLYQLFMERSLDLLKHGGTLSFIIPNKFLMSLSAKALRELLLKEGCVRSLVDFRSHKVFPDAATVPCVITYQHRNRQPQTRVIHLESLDAALHATKLSAPASVSRITLGKGPWQLGVARFGALAESISAQHPTLAMFSSRISAGLATGLDSAFVVPRASCTEIEEELRRPAVRGRDIYPYEIRDAGLDIVVPYAFDKSRRAALVDLARFPGFKAHISAFSAQLRRRHCHRVWQKEWYDVHDPVTCDVANLPKILVPDVARSNRFAYDEARNWPLHSVYYVVPDGIDPRYLTAVLNSKPIEFLIRLSAPVVKDGFSRYRRQFLATLPVPRCDAVLEKDLVRAAEFGDADKADALVESLFGLTRRDLAVIGRYLDSA